jgi:hypothetical protein
MEKETSKLIGFDDGIVNVLHALQSKWAGSHWQGNGKTYNDILWLDTSPITKPSEEEVNTEVVRLQTEYDAQEYARNRKAEYDALNQFELISDDDVNGTTTHKDAIAAIKTKYPKG